MLTPRYLRCDLGEVVQPHAIAPLYVVDTPPPGVELLHGAHEVDAVLVRLGQEPPPVARFELLSRHGAVSVSVEVLEQASNELLFVCVCLCVCSFVVVVVVFVVVVELAVVHKTQRRRRSQKQNGKAVAKTLHDVFTKNNNSSYVGFAK